MSWEDPEEDGTRFEEWLGFKALAEHAGRVVRDIWWKRTWTAARRAGRATLEAVDPSRSPFCPPILGDRLEEYHANRAFAAIWDAVLESKMQLDNLRRVAYISGLTVPDVYADPAHVELQWERSDYPKTRRRVV